jgi:hypothetical protein
MPTFYFDLWDGKRIGFADVGLELNGPENAFEEAIRGARDMLRDARIGDWDASSWAYQVRDEGGRIAFTVPFSIAAPGQPLCAALARLAGGPASLKECFGASPVLSHPAAVSARA